jgi:replicative DNA helicase
MCILEDIRESNLVVIAGTPNSGRTTLAINLSENIRHKEYSEKSSDYNCLVRGIIGYSTILSEQQLNRLFDYSYSHPSFYLVKYFSGCLEDLKKTIIKDKLELKAKINNEVKEWADNALVSNKTTVIVDMFHFLDEPLLSNENETVRISKIITELKRIAEELNLTIICTSEVNMDSVRKKRKDLLCLRDSIKIGSIADIVFLIDPENKIDSDWRIAINLKNRIGIKTNLGFDNCCLSPR